MSNERKIVLELTKVPYHNPTKNAFAILKGIIREVDEHGKQDAIGKILTAKGNIHSPVIGAYYKLTGVAKFEADFNEYQFCFSSYEVNQTATATGTQNYLVKECPGIGEGRAKQIVELFGKDTLAMLAKRESISLVAEKIAGLDLKAATEICDWAIAESVLLPVKQKLYEAGMTQGLIKTLTKNYGTRTEQVLREDCFALTEIKGIGFLTADKIAKKFGMSETNPKRVRQGVLHALSDVMDDKGHTCIEHHTLINAACELLTVHKSFVIDIMKQMIADGDLCTDRTDPKTISKIPELFEEKQPLSQTPTIQKESCSPKNLTPDSPPKHSGQSHPLPTSPTSATLAVAEEASELSSSEPALLAKALDSGPSQTKTLPPNQPTNSPPPAKPRRRSARLSYD